MAGLTKLVVTVLLVGVSLLSQASSSRAAFFRAGIKSTNLASLLRKMENAVFALPPQCPYGAAWWPVPSKQPCTSWV